MRRLWKEPAVRSRRDQLWMSESMPRRASGSAAYPVSPPGPAAWGDPHLDLADHGLDGVLAVLHAAAGQGPAADPVAADPAGQQQFAVPDAHGVGRHPQPLLHGTRLGEERAAGPVGGGSGQYQ
ncbi:hypothetical protein GCM10010305_09560 [Streptomyces termitum]|uniref:Uncharacterized protein n=1 Tax=Streptomyces termitum TaxID=67368 RepID=A0A918SSU1_9ACTN|nr:hypothetical protein GCM10010305_09560 [Streptomyces termitum]